MNKKEPLNKSEQIAKWYEEGYRQFLKEEEIRERKRKRDRLEGKAADKLIWVFPILMFLYAICK